MSDISVDIAEHKVVFLASQMGFQYLILTCSMYKLDLHVEVLNKRY